MHVQKRKLEKEVEERRKRETKYSIDFYSNRACIRMCGVLIAFISRFSFIKSSKRRAYLRTLLAFPLFPPYRDHQKSMVAAETCLFKASTMGIDYGEVSHACPHTRLTRGVFDAHSTASPCRRWFLLFLDIINLPKREIVRDASSRWCAGHRSLQHLGARQI